MVLPPIGIESVLKSGAVRQSFTIIRAVSDGAAVDDVGKVVNVRFDVFLILLARIQVHQFSFVFFARQLRPKNAAHCSPESNLVRT